jgi:hypothetical protein
MDTNSNVNNSSVMDFSMIAWQKNVSEGRLGLLEATFKQGLFLLCAMLVLATLGVQLHAIPIPVGGGVTPYKPGNDVNLLYDQFSGTVAVFTSPTGFGIPPRMSVIEGPHQACFPVRPGWPPLCHLVPGIMFTQIVPGNFGGGPASLSDFLFYEKVSGVAEFYSFNWASNNNGPVPIWTLFKKTNLGSGWTHIIPGNFGGTSVTGQTDLLLYDATNGAAQFEDVSGQGNTNPMNPTFYFVASYKPWSPWTHIIPGNFGGTSVTGQTDLLFYDASTGSSAFCDVSGQGNINLMKFYYHAWSPWTHIIPGNFGGIGQTDLLFYNANTGSAAFYDVWGQGNINPMKSFNWSPGHSFILPGDFTGSNPNSNGQTDLMIDDGSSGTQYEFVDSGLNGIVGNPWPFLDNHNWSLMTTSFQVAPQITDFFPKVGPPNSKVTIKGKNLNGTQGVFMGVLPYYSGDPVNFTVIDSATITAIMCLGNTTSPNCLSDTGWIAVNTPAGRAVSLHEFVPQYQLPPPVVVPNLVGQSLQTAVQTLQQSGLQEGTVSGATGFNLVVVNQSPSAGSSVRQGSSVDLTVAAAPTGWSAITLWNNLPDDQSVYVDLYDYSTGSWSTQNNGNLLGPGESVTINFPTQTAYKVVDVNPDWCGGQNDPTNTDCVLSWEWTFPGNPQGPTWTGYMQ